MVGPDLYIKWHVIIIAISKFLIEISCPLHCNYELIYGVEDMRSNRMNDLPDNKVPSQSRRSSTKYLSVDAVSSFGGISLDFLLCAKLVMELRPCEVHKSGSFVWPLDITRFSGSDDLAPDICPCRLEDPVGSGWRLVFVDLRMMFSY